MKQRCGWVTDEPLYIAYHDEEWGVPLYDDHRLFEMLCLEGQQAGLSWWTVLQRRENYREAFAQFDPQIISQYTVRDVERLMTDEGLIRYDKKIESIITNAQAYLNITGKCQSFSDYIWQFVEGEPIENHYGSHKERPTETEISRAMSKQLKKDGFSYVGPTICYAYMQSVGMVNDHEVSCFRYSEIQRMKRNEISD